MDEVVGRLSRLEEAVQSMTSKLDAVINSNDNTQKADLSKRNSLADHSDASPWVRMFSKNRSAYFWFNRTNRKVPVAYFSSVSSLFLTCLLLSCRVRFNGSVKLQKLETGQENRGSVSTSPT